MTGKDIKILSASLERLDLPLSAPFGFKGAYINSLTQAVVTVRTDYGEATVPSTQSPLWSDAAVFSAYGAKADALMLSVTRKALDILSGHTYRRPDEVINWLYPYLLGYASGICGKNVRPTFVLNALVGVDIALWRLWCAANGADSFEKMTPSYAKHAMSARSDKLARIPLISYGVDDSGIKAALDGGSAILKIKIGAAGSNVSHEEDMRLMLEKDKKRLVQIHSAAKEYHTPLTKSGNVVYYLDANGRYDNAGRLSELLEYADGIGCLERIAMVEEPFAEDDDEDVSKLPVVINADESAHSPADVEKRISQGYRAVALKPIAKTLSVSFAMATAAEKSGAGCFCADLTVNPYLAEWNKQFASRITPLGIMNCGCVEVNGDSNYRDWKLLSDALPQGLRAHEPINGAFICDDSFFESFKYLIKEN